MMTTRTNARHAESRGFTLLETLIAITVLTFAIIGPFQIAEGVLASSYIARDQLSATALAQEGMEYVRNVRDSNAVYNIHHAGSITSFQGMDGTAGSPNCFTSSCTIDAGQRAVAACTSGSCQPLYITAGGLYTQNSAGNTATKFTRSVQFTALSATSTKATVTVSWTGHGSFSVVLTEIFTNWL